MNVTEHSDFQALHRKTMDEHKKFCGEQNNGACAAYVASASRLGMFDTAWDFMLSNFDAKAAREWGLTYCQVGDTRQSDCVQNMTFTSYPEALDWFLRHHGYRDSNAPPPRLPPQTPAQAAAAEIPVISTPEYMAESYSLCNPLAKCPPPRQILARLHFQIPSTNVRGEIRCEANETAVGIDIVNEEASQRLFLNDSLLLRVLDALKVNAMDECESALRAGRLRTHTKQVPTQFAARSANDFRATSRGLAEPWIVQQNAAKDRKLEQERIAALTRAFNEKAAAVRADFASKVGRPIQIVPIAELLANPFPYVDIVVSYTAHFEQMLSAHEGRFDVRSVNVVIRDIPTGLLRRPSAVVIAGKVVGNVPGANASEPVRVPLLSYSNIGTFQTPVDSFQKTSGGERRVIL